MRKDALGLWWRDEPVVKIKKEVVKCTPPEPVWLKPDYLPNLEEARNFRPQLMNDGELHLASLNRERLLFDVEVYQNYFLVSFASVTTGKIVYFEMDDETDLDHKRLAWILASFTIIGFNSKNYDLVMLALAMRGHNCKTLKAATNLIIYDNWRSYEVLKQFKTKELKEVDHIDLIEVAPLRASLKIYGGRLHVPRMQDLPFHPEAELSSEQKVIVRWYNINDLIQTGFLNEALKEQITLRENMSRRYNSDLRSKSDAQIAEVVLSNGIMRRTGQKPIVPEILPGTAYRYQMPHYLRYQTEVMQNAANLVANAWFVVGEDGACQDPPELRNFKVTIGGSTYTMGIGGLHSTEKTTAHICDGTFILSDRDVVSYYPQIILNQQLYPKHLGTAFLAEYQTIVDERINAKKAGDKTTADSLKITVNGTFGKHGNKHSILYSPDLVIQVTLSGQLSLLMLIEAMELNGIHVVSANTDGITMRCPIAKEQLMNDIVKWWEQVTGFETEEARYERLCSRDVNNYMAVKYKYDKEKKQWTTKLDGIKSKGAFSNPWGDPKLASFRMHKNPANIVCVQAVEELFLKGTPIEETIRNNKDVRNFISVRSVTGGAVKNGVYLGKSIRWYYGKDETGTIVYANSGKKVPKSDGAVPLMDLGSNLPADVNFDWYIEETRGMLRQLGYLKDEAV